MSQILGLGGGGNMLCPSISPLNPNFMFVACDMSGLYRSFDAGQHWQMIESDAMLASTRCPVTFDYKDSNTVYAFDPFRSLLRSSLDAGDTWKTLASSLPVPSTRVTAMISIPGASVNDFTRLFVGTDKGVAEFSVATNPPFVRWQAIGEVIKFVFLPQGNTQLLFLATTNGVWQYVQNQWGDFHTADLNLPMIQGTFDMSWCGIDANNSTNTNFGTPIRDLAGAASNTAFVLHVSVMTTIVSGGGNPTVGGGIYRFESGQTNWSRLPLPDLTVATRPARYDWLGMATNDTSTVYTTYCGPAGDLGVFKRVNLGTWLQVFTTNIDKQWADFDLSPGFGGPAHGFTVCASNSNIAAFTNYAEIYVTTNAGQTWAARYSTQEGTKAAGQPWSSAGLEVTTTWDYVIDSHNPQVHYICYTDIGLARSDNGGQRWTNIRLLSRQSGPYNTVYQLAIDPEPDLTDNTKPANIWAACSQLHDIPYKAQQGNQGYEGGVMMSTGANVGTAFIDFSVGSSPMGSLPIVGPVTSVLITPRDNQQVRYLYAAVYGVGVRYRKQTGVTWGDWTLVGSPAVYTVPHVYQLHLVGTTLFCVVAGGFGSANPNQSGGLWTMQVGGGLWTPINGTTLPSCNPTDMFAVDVNRIYLCANNYNSEPNPGLYFTLNATANPPIWTAYSPAPPVNPVNYTLYAPFMDQNGNLYVTTTYRGIFVRSGNNPWRYYKPISFVGAHRITFDGTTQYITSFGGGAWRVNRQCFFITDRSTFSKDLVDLLESQPPPNNTATFAKSFYIVFDDFVPSEFSITTATPTQTQLQQWAPSISFFNEVAKTTTLLGIQAKATSLLLQTSALDARQRIAFGYDVSFVPGGSAFTGLSTANPSKIVYVSARLDLYSCDASIELRSTTSPYMLDGDPAWLSQAICVFRIRDNETLFNTTLFPTDPNIPNNPNYNPPIAYIQSLLNSPAKIANDFDTIRDWDKNHPNATTARNQLEWAQMENGSNVYNFALARVLFPPQSGGTPLAQPIQAFFRLFRYAATNVIYDKASTYRIAPAGTIPLLGIDLGTNAIVSVPCFSEPRTSSSISMIAQTDSLNVKSITPSTTQETTIYFGCWLDLNQPTKLFPSNPGINDGPYTAPTQSFQDIVHGKHQCLVVELNYAPDPINSGDTASSSDKLSQKNLFILGSDNPGNAASHTVQHPFELQGATFDEIEGPPVERLAVGFEELLIHWNSLPRETQVTIFLPDVDVDEIIAAEAARSGPKFLTRVDAHTVQCRVDGNIAYIPLPINRQTNIPGLITLQLPQNVVRGQHFTVVLQQVSGRRRQIIGTFEISIPVQTAHELLPGEKRTLAVLKYVANNAPPGIARTEVLKRYLNQLEARVVGLGGDPTAIPASPYGAPGDYPGGCISTWLKRIFSHGCLTGFAGAAVLVTVGAYVLRKWLHRGR